MMITTAAPFVHQHQLPVHAAIEGPAACFRLLEINTHLGMKHDQFVGLLLSATDNRLVRHIADSLVGSRSNLST